MSGLMPPNILAYTGQVVVPYMRETFDPNSTNYQFNVPTIWINTLTEKAWILVAKPQNVAVWLEFTGGSGSIISVTPDSGGTVFPIAANINLLGDGTSITTVGHPGTATINVELLGDVATLYTENSGTAVPSGGNLNVLGTHGITTSGSGSTVTVTGIPSVAAASSSIANVGVSSYKNTQFGVDVNGFVTLAGSGGGAPILGVTVDAHTAPGTAIVVPNSTGDIIVTGGQVAAGTTTNVIRTDSLAANTYTVEVQRSQAVGSSTVGDNGVCHFDSSVFSVDTNGFVSVIGGLAFTSIKNQVFTSNVTYTPTSGMTYCEITVIGGGGAGGGAPATGAFQGSAGSGGGAGENAKGIFNAASIGASKAVTIGAAGTGVSASTGNTGGTTSVGSLITAVGGSGGTASGPASSPGVLGSSGGLGGTGGTGGDYRSPGQSGFPCMIAGGMTNGFSLSGQGGSSQLGSGGVGSIAAGGAAVGYGSGGGGAAIGQNSSATAGANGSAGIVIVTEYIIA